MKDKIMAISLGVCLIVIGFLGVLLYKSYNGNNDMVTFTEGYYINSVGTKIKEDDYKILSLTNSFEVIDTISEDDMEVAVRYYYSNMEVYATYGYVGSYEDTDIKAGINKELEVIKLVSKELPLIDVIIEDNVNEYYCVLGEDKYCNYILGEYRDNNCVITDFLCDKLKNNENKSYVDIGNYCK